jgi:hypothetical protein
VPLHRKTTVNDTMAMDAQVVEIYPSPAYFTSKGGP